MKIDFDKILRYLAGGNAAGIWNKIRKNTVFVDSEEFLDAEVGFL